MKNYLSLVSIEARVHRRQNRLTIFCIALAVFLVTGVFSMADMAVRMQDEKLKEKHGNWHISVHDVKESCIEEMEKESEIEAASFYDVLNEDLEKKYFLQKKSLCIATGDGDFRKIMRIGMEEGKFPETDTQIVLTENARKIWNLAPGERVTIKTPAGEMEYTISGFTEDTEKMMENDAIGAFVSRKAFKKICTENGEEQHPVCYLRFKESFFLKHNIQSFREKYHLGEDKVSENTAVMGMRGISSNSYFLGLYGAAAFLVFLVLVAGILMIAGSMNSNIAERTRFFGMLRCIGASRDQVKRIVRREALNWCRSAIPIGEILAVLGTWGICAFLRNRIGGEFAGIPTGKVSVVGLLCGAFTGIITVLLAAHAPAKRAAKVSPAAAVHGREEGTRKIRHAARTGWWKVDIALGIQHAAASRKKLLLMTGSFTLSILLFLSFSVMMDWVSHALNTLKPYTPDVSISDTARQNSISKDRIKQLENLPESELVFGRRYQNLPVQSDYEVHTADLISYGKEQFEWSQEDLLYGDIMKVEESDGYVMTVFEESSPFQLGDTLVINGKKLTVGAILGDSPFSSTTIPTILCSEDTFYQVTGNEGYAIVDMQLTDQAEDGTIKEIRSIMGEDYKVMDVRASNREINSTYYAFSFLVYAFLGLIALITVFNIMNSISMSVAARIRQCGMMRAVGMGKAQLLRIIASEALTYGICGCLAGCMIGLPVNRFFFSRLITDYWGTPWKIPVLPLGMILGLTLLAAAVSIYLPAKRIRKMTITDTIHAL